MTDSTSDGENARAYLNSLMRGDLSALLLHTQIDCGRLAFSEVGVVVVHAPQPFAEALSSLPPTDRQRIAEAVLSRRDLAVPDDIVVKIGGEPASGPATLLPDLIIHREMMISVATGGTEIRDVDDYYVARQFRLLEGCAAAGIRYENPHESLWDWFHHWKANGYDSWAERRQYIRKLFLGPVAAAVARANNPSPVVERGLTGWDRVDRSLAKARQQLSAAYVEEDWQGIGLVCREVLISLGQAVYVEDLHQTADGVRPSTSDAKRMIEAYVRHEMPGEGYKEVRAHARAAVDLAVHLQHRRTATRQLAALCLEATSSAVAVVAILTGRGV